MKQKREMQVIYIITKLELGGAQKICLSLFKKIPTTSCTTSLITGAHGLLMQNITQNAAQDAAQDADSYILTDLKREVSFLGCMSEIKTFITLVKQLRKLKQKSHNTIVHTHSTKAGLLGRWAAFFAGIKQRVHTIHGYSFHDKQAIVIRTIHYLLELITSFITTHYITVSSADVRTGIALFPGFTYKHSLIRASVDDTYFEQNNQIMSFPIPNHPFIFGTVSCFKPQKNLIDLLKAFTVVHHQNKHTRLEIIGDGIQRPIIEQWLKEHNLTDAVILHGWQHDVTTYLKRWHAFVLSSLWEGLPCAVVEACLYKLPVVCYNTGGISDVIVSGSNGLLYPRTKWQELSQGMYKLTQDKQLYQKLQNFNADLSDFAQSTMIMQHQALYRHLITQKLEQKQLRH